MRTTVATLTFILVAGAAFASGPAPPAPLPDPGTAVAPSDDAPVSAVGEALPSPSPGLAGIGTSEALPPQQAPVEMANLCLLECRIERRECLQVSPPADCDVAFEICAANC